MLQPTRWTPTSRISIHPRRIAHDGASTLGNSADRTLSTAQKVRPLELSLDIDTKRDVRSALEKGLLLFGHSAGGVAAFHSLLDHLSGSVRLPCPIVGLASYGSGSPLEIDSAALPPVLLLSGEEDTVVPSRLTEAAYERLGGSNRTYILLADLAHYSITDSGHPESAPPEERPPSGSTRESVALLAKFVHEFSRAVMTGNRQWTVKVSEGLQGQIRNIMTGT